MSEKQRFVKTPNFATTKRVDLQLLYTTGVLAGLNPVDGHMFFIADRLEMEPGDVPGSQKLKAINQEIQAEIHMSPRTFKNIALTLMRHVEQYEKRFGEIKMLKGKTSKKLDNKYVK